MNLAKAFSRTLLSGIVTSILYLAPNSKADDMYVWVEEVGGNVIFHHEGSIDLTGFPMILVAGELPSIRPNNGSYFAINAVSDIYEGVVPDGPTRAFGTGALMAASSLSGDVFACDSGDNLALPEAYVSKSPINGSMTFLATTLATLGVDTTPFTYATTVGTNTVHMFTLSPAEVAARAAAKAKLLRQIRKLKKKARKLKKKGKKAKAKKLGKKVKKLQAQIRALG